MRAINLIPVEQRSGQPVGAGRSQGGAYAVLLVVGGLALMAFLYGQSAHQVKSRQAQATSLAAQAQQAQAEAERLAPYTSFIALREQRVKDVEGLVDSRFDWAHVLHEFGRVLPLEASISTLTGTIGGSGSTSASTSSSSAAGATPPGSLPTFTLAGCATSQSAVALTLERLHLIDGVKEVSLGNSTLGSSSGAASGGGCAGHDASFTATVTFEALPSSASVAAATKTSSKVVSDSASANSSAPATTPGASAR